MKFRRSNPAIALSLVLVMSAPTDSGASSMIGTVMTRGTFRLDSATVRGNATLVEGALLETLQAASEVELNSGARISLAARSKARFFAGRMVLETGEGRLESAVGYRLEALDLTIRPQTAKASGRVSLSGPNRLLVAAVDGAFRVLNPHGVVVANLTAGNALEFEPQQDASGARVNRMCRQSRWTPSGDR